MIDKRAVNSRELIKSMMIIGSAQGLSILMSIIKLKGVAILLGPSGIGLLGIYNSFLAMMQKSAGLGMKMSGVREIAASSGEEKKLSLVRRVLFIAHLLQGLIAMISVWLLRENISIWLFGEIEFAEEVGLVGLAILFALLSSSQVALLQGMRKINNLGRITVIGAFVTSLTGLFIIWLIGQNGLIWFVIIQPLTAFIVAMKYTKKLPKPLNIEYSLKNQWSIWKSMAKIGIAFMLGGLISTVTILIVRSKILQELGLDAAGHFAAAWGLTMTYIGPMLAAMGADYYPRLTEVIKNKYAAINLMNDQAQLGLSIGGPLLILLIGFAPWVITLLYSSEFYPAVALLQWQAFGNIFKILVWSIVFSHIAAGHSKTFFFLDISFNIVFLCILWPLLFSYGILIIGPAFAIANGFSLVLNIVFAKKYLGFKWDPLSLKLLILQTVLALITLIFALQAPLMGAIFSLIIASITGVFGLRIVVSKIGQNGSIPKKIYNIFKRVNWPIKIKS